MAGAAEEILGKRLRKIGREPSFDNLRNAIVKLVRQRGDTDPKIDTLVGELLNSTRNQLKHYSGDETIEFDLREDAIEMLERAISNFTLLTNNVTSEMFDFWGSLDDT